MQRTRVNTSIPKFSRKESNVSEASKPYEAFQQISSKELSDLSIFFFIYNNKIFNYTQEPKEQEVFSYHLEGNNLPEFLQRPLFYNSKEPKISEKIRKNEPAQNNFFDILNGATQSNEKLPLETHKNEKPNEKPTSMNNLSNTRPNTADADFKIVFQRGHRMFSKGLNAKEREEKKEVVMNKPQMKRAGTSNLLFRKTSKNGKRHTEFAQNQEGKGIHVNLFEKYQNFLVIN